MNYKIIASNKIWLESNAIMQLKTVSKLKGVVSSVGYQDLHPGRGIPIGVSIITKGVIYPHLIGNDIGCGMSLFKTLKTLNKFNKDKIVKRLERIKSLSDIEIDDFNGVEKFRDELMTDSLGTIGKGNHFVELQQVDKILNKDLFEESNLDKKLLYILIHSGSRGNGEYILRYFIEKYKAQNGIDTRSEIAAEYISLHNDALAWAKTNRSIIAGKFYKAMGYNGELTKLVDHYHNFLEIKDDFLIHRKGTNRADDKLVIIPGSRGALTYLLRPITSTFDTGFSLPHGAGRKWDRHQSKGKLNNKYTKQSIKHSKIGSTVVCSDYTILFEEAPEAYKNIDVIIRDLEEQKMVEVVATFKPVITFKDSLCGYK